MSLTSKRCVHGGILRGLRCVCVFWECLRRTARRWARFVIPAAAPAPAPAPEVPAATYLAVDTSVDNNDDAKVKRAGWDRYPEESAYFRGCSPNGSPECLGIALERGLVHLLRHASWHTNKGDLPNSQYKTFGSESPWPSNAAALTRKSNGRHDCVPDQPTAFPVPICSTQPYSGT